MQSVVIKPITAATVANLLESSTTEQTVDTGPTLVSTLIHSVYGLITIITNMIDDTGVLLVSPQFADQIPA